MSQKEGSIKVAKPKAERKSTKIIRDPPSSAADGPKQPRQLIQQYQQIVKHPAWQTFSRLHNNISTELHKYVQLDGKGEPSSFTSGRKQNKLLRLVWQTLHSTSTVEQANLVAGCNKLLEAKPVKASAANEDSSDGLPAHQQ
jgi:hypothetical protein